jgi:hypothetical protein
VDFPEPGAPAMAVIVRWLWPCSATMRANSSRFESGLPVIFSSVVPDGLSGRLRLVGQQGFSRRLCSSVCRNVIYGLNIQHLT